MVVNGNILGEVVTFIQGTMGAFLPLLCAVIGLFLAFEIAEKLRFFVIKAVKK